MKEMKRSGQAWLGDIPKEWDYVPLKAIFNRRTQKNNPIISTERLSLSIDKGITLYADKTTNLDRFKDDFTQYQLAYPGDIVLNCMNMIVGAIGLSRYFGCVSPIYYVIYPVANNTNVDYYNYLLNISSIKDLYRSLGQGIYAIDRGDGRVNTCRLKVSYDDFGKIRLPLPSTKEQQAIADFLDVKCAEVDELIALQEKMIDELKVYKQSVITEAVTKGLNPDAPLKDSGIEWIGQIPEHWRMKKLKNILRTSLQYGANESGIPYNDNLPRYVRITDITDNTLKEDIDKQSLTEKQAKGYILEDKDILFARSGATVGKTFMYNQHYGICAFAGYLIKASIDIYNSPKFIHYYTLTHSYEEWKKQIFIQATIQNIGADRYAQLTLPIPSIEEQQQIADYLDTKCSEIDEMTSIKQQKIEQLKEYKKSIIYEYVTGKRQII